MTTKTARVCIELVSRCENGEWTHQWRRTDDDWPDGEWVSPQFDNREDAHAFCKANGLLPAQ